MLFNRFLEVQFFAEKSKQPFLTIGGRQHLVDGNLSVPVRIEFDFTHTSSREASEGTVTFFNLSNATIEKINKENLLVQVEAGYWPEFETRVTGRIFSGRVTKCITTKSDGVTKQTQLTVKHGWKGIRETKTAVVYPAGTSHETIVRKLVADMVTTDDELSVGTITVPEAFEVRPRTIEMTTVRALDDYCSQHDLEWNIIDGKVHVTPVDEELYDSQILFTPDTGMIGEPQLSDQGTDITVVMIPYLRPKQTIYVENRYVSRPRKAYVIDEVQFRGCNSDGDFGATIKSRATKDKPKSETKQGTKRSQAKAGRRKRQK